jgi:excisionase family DNA binding protein
VREHEKDIEPILLKYRETARLLNISERHVENLAVQGLLEKVRLGDTAVRITRASALKLAGIRTVAA